MVGVQLNFFWTLLLSFLLLLIVVALIGIIIMAIIICRVFRTAYKGKKTRSVDAIIESCKGDIVSTTAYTQLICKKSFVEQDIASMTKTDVNIVVANIDEEETTTKNETGQSEVVDELSAVNRDTSTMAVDVEAVVDQKMKESEKRADDETGKNDVKGEGEKEDADNAGTVDVKDYKTSATENESKVDKEAGTSKPDTPSSPKQSCEDGKPNKKEGTTNTKLMDVSESGVHTADKKTVTTEASVKPLSSPETINTVDAKEASVKEILNKEEKELMH